MSIAFTLAAGPWGIGWQEIIVILLVIGILAVPGIIALAIIFFILRRQRRRKAVSSPLPEQYYQHQ